MRVLFVVIAVLITGLQGLSAQEVTDPEEMFEFGYDFFLAEEYEESVYYYKQLLEKFPDNANYNWKVGETYLEIAGQEHNAIPYLEKAIQQTNLKYKSKDYSEVNAPHHAMFYLGNAYSINNEIDKALITYQDFTESDDFEDNYNIAMVDEEVAKCQRAYIIQDVPLNYKKTRLGEMINNNRNNFNPILSGDGNTMVFVSSTAFFDGINLSKKEDGVWSAPMMLNPQVQSDGLHYPTALNYDGTELYMVERRQNNYDIYVSHMEDPFWTKAEKLGKNINTGGQETHACITADGNTLYFTSDRSDGFGGLDIYTSQRTETGEWGVAENLGSTINSEFDEETPFITTDNSRLYFSSNGHFNMGGFDIFFSDHVNGEWRDPVNRGYPLNTTRDDLFYFPINKRDLALYAVIEKDGPGTYDIYQVEILPEPKTDQATGDIFFDSDFNLMLIDQEALDTLIIRYDKLEQNFHLIQRGSKYKIVVID